MSESKPPFRLAICGAGLAGLILAVTIGKYNPSIPVDLYEAQETISTVGAGITLWRQTHEVMAALGLFDDMKLILSRDLDTIGNPTFRRSDIPEGGYIWFHRNSQNISNMHRQPMIAILKKHLPPSCTVIFKKRLVGYVESKGQDAPHITLEFADGTTAIADVLVGADGIRSAVRKTMFETTSQDRGDVDKIDYTQYAEAAFTGITIYRSLVPTDKLNPDNVSLKDLVTYTGKGRNIVTYPIVNGSLINVVATISDPKLSSKHHQGHWVSETTQDELAAHFDDFEPDAKALVMLCEKPSKWALHAVNPLPFCTQKTVVLVGDACHAMTPYSGAGAGQAIEDAFVLGMLLAHRLCTLSRIPDVFSIFQDIRLPLAHEISAMSSSTGRIYSFMEPGFYDGTRTEEDLDERGIGACEREGMEAARKELTRRWDWMEGLRSPIKVSEEAEAKLRALAEESG